MQGSINVQGRFRLEICDRYGRLRRAVIKKNLIVNGGLGLFAHALVDPDAIDPLKAFWIHIGANSTPPDPEDTGIINILRYACTAVESDGPIAKFETAFDVFGAPVCEAGIFANADNWVHGTMLARVVFPEIKPSDIPPGGILRIFWSFTFARKP